MQLYMNHMNQCSSCAALNRIAHNEPHISARLLCSCGFSRAPPKRRCCKPIASPQPSRHCHKCTRECSYRALPFLSQAYCWNRNGTLDSRPLNEKYCMQVPPAFHNLSCFPASTSIFSSPYSFFNFKTSKSHHRTLNNLRCWAQWNP